eukprot:11583356-Karenia_brevis.AAC.1
MAGNGSMDHGHGDAEKLLRNPNTLVCFGENPHKIGTKIHSKFEAVRGAKSISEAKKDATLWELRD